MKLARLTALALVAALPLALLACGDDDDDNGNGNGNGNGGGETRNVTLMLDWTPNTNHLGFYIAREQGWYEEEGLAVQLVEPAPAGVEQVVGAGQAQFGISFQEYVTPARAEDIPIVSIAAIIQHNTSSFMSLTSAGIESAGDLEGKRYGGFVSPLAESIVRSLVACEGGDPASVEFVDAAIDPLIGLEDGHFDFFWVFDAWDGIRAEQIQDYDVNFVRFIDYVECIPDWYTPVIITNEDLIANDPELVSAFMRATARGYEFAQDNPGEAAEILLEAVPELDEELVTLSSEYLSTRWMDDGRAWGQQDEDVWTRFTEYLVDGGMLEEAIDVNAAFTNEFLPED